MIIFYPLFLILPYIFYLIEKVFPYPHLIEEIGKFFLIYLILKFEEKEKKDYPLIILFGGFLFSLSESFFYLSQIILTGGISLYLMRLLLTFLIHFLTLVIFYLSGKRFYFKGLLLALAVNIIIHYFYNFYLVYEF